MSVETVSANLLVGALVVVSLVLSAMAVRAWRYARGGRQLALASAFVILLAKAAVLAWGLFALDDWASLLFVTVALDLVALLAFYFASLR